MDNIEQQHFTSNHYELVPATQADFAFAYHVKKVAYKIYVEQTWGWDEDFQTDFHSRHFSPEHTFIIHKNGEPIGTVDVNERGDSLFISGLYLLPEFQNKGIGTSIIQSLVEKGRQLNKSVELEVLKVNARALKLYLQLGFVLRESDEQKHLMYKPIEAE